MPRTASTTSSRSSSTGSDDEDNNWDDLVDDSQQPATLSLFEDKSFPSVEEAIANDREKHGFDLIALCSNLSLDPYQRIRLVNYIRSQKPPPNELTALGGTETFFGDDTYLKPVIEDDPLLQLQMDEWSSDSELDASTSKDISGEKELIRTRREVKKLRERLAKAQQDLADYQALVQRNLANIANDTFGGVTAEDIRNEELPTNSNRDDDTHYFESYNEQAIHYIMLTDRVRTSTYATFILSNPSLFQNAVVMDVGCGTGILSLFAARAGAKRVIAVEASKIGEKADANFKASGYADKITLVRSKVENIKSLPDDIPHVDVILSEWMGYSLLYESMLDSVLVARDRFLHPGGTFIESPGEPAKNTSTQHGVMAPSQCRIMLALADPQTIVKERVGFWKDVYGFDMSAMSTEAYDDAIIDYVANESLLSDSCIVKDLNLQTIAAKELSFTAPFTLKAKDLPTSPASKVKSGNTYFLGKLHNHRTYATAFVLWFDTFFHPTGQQYPPEIPCKVHTSGDGDWETGDVLKLRPSHKRRKTLESKEAPNVSNLVDPDQTTTEPQSIIKPSSVGKIDSPLAQMHGPGTAGEELAPETREESFTTGPHGTPTHWKQTVFLLKTPIEIRRGTEIHGTFSCWKNAENSRELDVELRYTIINTSSSVDSEKKPGPNAMPHVQSFKVR